MNKIKGYPVIQDLCEKYHIQIDVHDRTIEKLSPKNNCYAIGVFQTYTSLLHNGNHVVLEHPMDMGNMGTIMRTMLGFGYKDLVIIKPAVDIFDPKVIRASMGAIFHLNIAFYDTFEDLFYNHSIIINDQVLKQYSKEWKKTSGPAGFGTV